MNSRGLSAWNTVLSKGKFGSSPDDLRHIHKWLDDFSGSETADDIIKKLNEEYMSAFFDYFVEDLPFDDDDPIYSVYPIMKLNLYSILLLETMGQTLPGNKFITLKNLIEENGEYLSKDAIDKVSDSEFYRVLAGNFPAVLRELFVIQKKGPRQPYQIATRYPKLLFAMLHSCRNMPLVDDGSTSNSFEYSSRFYYECMRSICQCGWDETSLAQYYILERLFRLNTKVALFKGEYNCGEKRESVSPGFLADFLFPSPIVLLPQDMLPRLLYEEWSSESIGERQAFTLRFLIRFSYNFYYTLEALRKIIQDRGYCSPKEVTAFFFPGGKDEMLTFIEKRRPEKHLTLENAHDNQKARNYSKEWRTFVPTEPVTVFCPHTRTERVAYIHSNGVFLSALAPKGHEDYAMMTPYAYESHHDQAVLAQILADGYI